MSAIRANWFEAEKLIRATQDGDLKEVQRLSGQGYDINLMDEIGNGALHYAVEGDHYKVALWLLANGAEANLYDPEVIGETPLALATQRDYPEMVELLLKFGADPDITGWMMQSARTRARERKDEDGSKIAELIEKYKPALVKPDLGYRK